MLGLRIGGAAACLALLLWPSVAHATPSARLVYSRTADAVSCPDETLLRAAVAARVGYDAFFPWAPRTVVVAIVRREGSFAATVNLVDDRGIDHGAHELRSQGACVELLDAVALAVAIAIDPQRTMAMPSPARKPDPSPLPEPPSPPDMPSPPEPIAPQSLPTVLAPPRVRFEASLGVAGALGEAPGPALGGTLGVGVRGSRFSLALEGQLNRPSTTTGSSGSTASVWLAAGALVPCVSFGIFFGCAVAEVGSLQSDASGTLTRSRSTVWGALGGRVGALVPLTSHLSLRGRIDLVGDLSPTSVVLDGSSPWTAPLVAGSLGIDAVWRF